MAKAIEIFKVIALCLCLLSSTSLILCVMSSIRSEPSGAKTIPLVAQLIVSVDVINNFLVVDSLNKFTDDTKDADGTIL